MCQVSRFDPWKDPLGVIDAYRVVKETIPDVQLALVGSMASDDPEGWDFFNATVAHADGDGDIDILDNFNNVGAIEVNAFQSHADVLIQKSTREGFGLTVSEAIWKARPFIGGDIGGIPLQIEDGVTGFLVSSAEQCAQRTLEILRDPELGRSLGQARQGARAHALPHAALPARLSAHLQRAERGMSERRRHSGPPLVLVSNRGPVTFHADGEVVARLRRPGDGADRPRVPPRSDLDRLSDERRTTRRSRVSTAAVRSRCAHPRGGEYQVRLVVSDGEHTTASTTSSRTRCCGSSSTTCGTCPTLPTSAARRSRPSSSATTSSTKTSRAPSSSSSRAPHEPVVMVHDYHLYTLPDLVRRARPGRLPAPLHPHPLDAARRLAGAADAHPRGDLHRPARERHHRLPHPLLPEQLPAVLPRPDGSRGRLRARRRGLRRARGVGARLPAADRPPRHPPDRAAASASRSSSASCSRAGATS